MTTAVVGGALANKAGYGGEAWIRMSWVMGLRRLGIDAWLVEDLDSAACTDRDGAPVAAADSYNLAYFRAVVAEFGLADRSVLRVDGGAEIYGAGADDADVLAALAEETALVINIGGHLSAATLFPRARRVYVDIDPGWTQSWHVAGDPDWPVSSGADTGRFTTVATWRNPFGPVAGLAEGERALGAKHHEFRRFVELPRESAASYELALRIDPGDDADRLLLAANGWTVVDAAEVVRTPADFHAYVQGSRAEFSPAQGVYAHTASGWFSDRSVRYLASGRPVLVQDTGLAAHLPVGEGLVTFASLAGARDGAARIDADSDVHRAAARDIAERYFDSDIVLSRLLDEVGIS